MPNVHEPDIAIKLHVRLTRLVLCNSFSSVPSPPCSASRRGKALVSRFSSSIPEDSGGFHIQIVTSLVVAFFLQDSSNGSRTEYLVDSIISMSSKIWYNTGRQSAREENSEELQYTHKPVISYLGAPQSVRSNRTGQDFLQKFQKVDTGKPRAIGCHLVADVSVDRWEPY
jgi:hypothetical protein